MSDFSNRLHPVRYSRLFPTADSRELSDRFLLAVRASADRKESLDAVEQTLEQARTWIEQLIRISRLELGSRAISSLAAIHTAIVASTGAFPRSICLWSMGYDDVGSWNISWLSMNSVRVTLVPRAGMVQFEVRGNAPDVDRMTALIDPGEEWLEMGLPVRAERSA